MASLLVVTGPSAGDYYLLGKHAVTIGRDEGCPIQIVDDTVSRQHLQVRRADKGTTFHALDLNSANGTLINDRPLAEETAFADGDIVTIGKTELMFSAIDFADSETAFQHYRRRGEGLKSTIIRKK